MEHILWATTLPRHFCYRDQHSPLRRKIPCHPTPVETGPIRFSTHHRWQRTDVVPGLSGRNAARRPFHRQFWLHHESPPSPDRQSCSALQPSAPNRILAGRPSVRSSKPWSRGLQNIGPAILFHENIILKQRTVHSNKNSVVIQNN